METKPKDFANMINGIHEAENPLERFYAMTAPRAVRETGWLIPPPVLCNWYTFQGDRFRAYRDEQSRKEFEARTGMVMVDKVELGKIAEYAMEGSTV